MLSLLIGTAVIVAPVHIGIPAGVAVAGLRATLSAAKRRQMKKAAQLKSNSAEKLEATYEQLLAEEAIEPVMLAWTDLHCSLQLKDGTSKPILRGVSGVARPGR